MISQQKLAYTFPVHLVCDPSVEVEGLKTRLLQFGYKNVSGQTYFLDSGIKRAYLYWTLK